MKIDNIDNISNKEKSPDKAERSASIEELKKTQNSKFFNFNDLSNSAAVNDAQLTIPQEKETSIFNCLAPETGSAGGGSNGGNSIEDVSGGSKLKKLLLNSDPEVVNSHHEKVHNSEYLNTFNNNTISSSKNINHDANSGNNSINNLSTNSTINNHNSSRKIISGGGSHSKLKSDAANATVTASVNLQSSNKKEINEKKKEATNNSNTKKVFLCSECNEYVPQARLFYHMKSVHSKFTCLYCYGFFLKIEALQRHLMRKHKVQNTSFTDEYALENYFNVKREAKELEGTAAAPLVTETTSTVTRVIKAACCKCSAIFAITDESFRTHCCDGKSLTAAAKAKIQVVNRNPITSDGVDLAVQQNDLNFNVNDEGKTTSHKQAESTKEEEEDDGKMREDVYSKKAIDQWLQPSTAKTTFNGASAISNDTTSQSVSHSADETTTDTSWQIEEQKLTNTNPEKLVVPKLTLKIPKAFQNQQYNDIDSDEDSGDEEDDEDENEQDGSASEGEESLEPNKSKTNANIYSSSSLSDESENEESSSIKKNMPIKLTIKNLTSTPIVLDTRTVAAAAAAAKDDTADCNQADVDMTECAMDIEPALNDAALKTQEEKKEPGKWTVDGLQLTQASEDFLPLEICLDEGLDKIDILKLMKICLRASFPFCLYCNHARKIVVNGKGLAMHFFTHHRFHATVESITAEELHPEKFNSKFEQSLEELQQCYFNLDTYDDHDEAKKEGHVTISHDKLYECFQCRFQTPIHKELYLHNRKMHQKSLINCLMCKMSFYSYSELLCHICPGVANKATYNDYKFYCCLCNMNEIPSAFRLMVHLRKKHYGCDICLEKCSDQSKLSSHVWKHKLSHICFRCHIFYQNKADIMKHLFWKHGTEGIECKKCLQKKWPHVYHFCIPPATFTCTHCEMQFTRAMSLKIHLRLHEDGAKYACTELGCEKKFISKKLLIRHLERHQSELAAQQRIGEGDQERTEGTVIIPAEIQDGFCTRTMPVVFKRFIKKPAVRKLEHEPKVEQTKTEPDPPVEKKKEKGKTTLLDLPETKLNLSESSDSDSSVSDGEPEKKIKAPASLAMSPKQQELQETSATASLPSTAVAAASELSASAGDMNKSMAQLNKVSTLSDSDDEEDDVKDAKPPVGDDNSNTAVDSMQNIMENLKNYRESQQPLNNGEDCKEKVKSDLKENLSEPAASEVERKPVVEEEKKENEAIAEEDVVDKLPEKVVLHVCRSDHDYAKLYRPAAGTTAEDLEEMISSATIDKDKNKKSETDKDEKSKVSSKAEQSKKKAKNDDFSSSDSSSGGSSSDSSSGSSSGSSSSSSSGSSSDSSSSEASSTKMSNNKPRNKKFTKKRSKKDKKAEAEPEEEEPVRDPDEIIYESDLQTDETDTDEDFYDEHPLKMNLEGLTEKRKQLGNIDEIIENSRPSTPSLPPDEKVEKRLKTKKRKREHKKSPAKRMHYDPSVIVNPDDDSMSHHSHRVNQSSQPATPQRLVFNFKQNNHAQQGFIHTSTPKAPAPPRIELHQANQIRQLLQSTQQQPILPILMEQQQAHNQSTGYYQNNTLANITNNDYINVSHVSSAQSSRMNSDNESGIKRSQRRRIPNKFYGYTSDDDSMASLVQNPNDPFKPIPPPLLTWDKDDLPTRTKSPIPIQQQQQQQQPPPPPQQQQAQPQRIAPLKLIINGDQLQQQQQPQPLIAPPEIHDNFNSSQQQQQQQLPINNLSTSMKNDTSSSVAYNHYQSDSGSSDDDQLHISEPGKRKRKLPSQNMYAFHTLETPATVAVNQPPIPRLKLTIGSNNKIRRRNINPLKPPAKKRKVVPKSNNSSSVKSTLNSSVQKSLLKSQAAETQGTSSRFNAIEQSKPSSGDGRVPKQVLAKEERQQKLEEAIMNTQQYFQRYNHAQVANDIPQDSADNDGRVYCYCRRPYDDLQGMIGCDGPNCHIEWFHFECVGILVPPKGNWFCPQCQKEQLTG